MTAAAASENSDDAELRRRILNGETAAFEALHVRYNRRLELFLKNRCRPPIDPDDLRQDVWQRVFERRAQWNPTEGNFISWLLTIARNMLMNTLRQRQRRPEQRLAEDADPVAPTSEEDNPQLQALRQCLDQLGGPFVQILKLRLNDGFSDAELAELLGITVGTVYSRASRGRDEVRQCVERKLA